MTTAVPHPARSPEWRRVVDLRRSLRSFGVLTFIEFHVPAHLYPFVYALKVCAVTVSLAVGERLAGTVTPSSGVLCASFLVGVLVFVAWVGWSTSGCRTRIWERGWGSTVLGAFSRMGGALPRRAVLRPRADGSRDGGTLSALILLRYLTNHDSKGAPRLLRMVCVWIVAALSAASHPEWPSAVVASCAYALLLRRTGVSSLPWWRTRRRMRRWGLRCRHG